KIDCGNTFARIVPVHACLSSLLMRKIPRFPDVPDDNPTVVFPIIGEKSRNSSAFSATENASSFVIPKVLKVSKEFIIIDLSIIGKFLQSLSSNSCQRE